MNPAPAPSSTATLTAALVSLHAAHLRLLGKDLMQERDSISLRVPAADSSAQGFYWRTGANGIAGGIAGDASWQWQALQQACPPGSPAEIHRLAYLSRGDVGAIACTSQALGSHLHLCGERVPSVFDEQLRCLGKDVPTLRSTLTLAEAKAAFAGGQNAFVLHQPHHDSPESQCLVFGFTPELLAFNTELLEKCAKAYLFAASTGMPIGAVPWIVRWVTARRLAKDRQQAARAFAGGQWAVIQKRY